MRKTAWVTAAFAATLAGCGPFTFSASREPAATAAPATPSGPPVQVALHEGEHPEASVNQVALLRSGAKVYSVVGGDPAINGLYTFITVYAGEAAEITWRVFQIGDFNTWSVVEDRGDTVVLTVNRQWFDDNDQVQSADERLIVSVPDDDDTSITITPAN